MAEHRRRYDELKAAGTGGTGLALPPATPLDAPPIAPDAVLTDETIPGGWYAALRMRRGEGLRLVDVEGTGSVAFFAWSAADPSERLNHADTIKVQWTAKLSRGRILFSDMGRALVSIVEDTTDGGHDALAGVSNAASTRAKYGEGAYRNGRDNLVLAAAKLGLSRRDLAPVITFFSPVSVESEGALRFSADRKAPGAFVDLRAEMDLLVALSFAPHPLDPAPGYAPGPVRVIRHRLPEATAGDACRTATAEAARAFANLDTHLA
jgi:urea carboxylase-associated protein 2